MHVAIYARLGMNAEENAEQTKALSQWSAGVKGSAVYYEDHAPDLYWCQRVDQPQWRKIQTLIPSEVDQVVVWRLDRLLLSAWHLWNLLDTFQKQGVKFYSIKEAFDPASTSGEYFMLLLKSMAQCQKEITQQANWKQDFYVPPTRKRKKPKPPPELPTGVLSLQEETWGVDLEELLGRD